MVDSKNPEQMFLRCAGSLGWAFPAAMGAKCAVPDRPVMCFTGDGGFLVSPFRVGDRRPVRHQHADCG